MTEVNWWANLLQGSVGSAISLIGLFSVFYLTRRHEKRRDQELQLLESHRRIDEQVRSEIASVIESSYSLRVYDEGSDAHARALAHSLMMLSVRAVERYPNAADWARTKSIDVLDALAPGNDPRALIWESAYITGRLSQWISKGLPDSMFPKPEQEQKSRASRDEEVEELFLAARKELERRNLTSTFENMRTVFHALLKEGPDSPNSQES